MSTDSLVEYARNPRKNDVVVDKMVACIKEFGFRIPIVAKSDGTVIDGHLRLKAAKKLGLKEVPIVIADDLSDAQIKAFRLVANQSANWAEWDEELLKLEFEELQDANFDLNLTGFDLDEIDRLLHQDNDIINASRSVFPVQGILINFGQSMGGIRNVERLAQNFVPTI